MGGLANRIRVIASGITLTRKLNTRLTVIWNENYELNCPYHLLFEDEGIFNITHKKRKYRYLKSPHQKTIAKRLTARLINKLAGVDYFIQEDDFPDRIWTRKLDILETVSHHGTTYIQTCQEFGDNTTAFSSFRPIPPLREKIETLVKQFTGYTIGIHIRRTDHTSAIRNSPIGLFINQMRGALAAKKGTVFFLCTDDGQTEQSLKDTFETKLILHEKDRSRQTVKGIQDAVVDLFGLSRTAKIIGSYGSSYAEVAAALGHIELEVLNASPVK